MQPPDLEPYNLEFATQLASKIEQFLIQTHEVNLRSTEDFGHIVYLFGQDQVRRYAAENPEQIDLEDFNMERATCTTRLMIPSSDEPGARQMHFHLVYLPDSSVIEAADGTDENHGDFVEETSHAVFHFNQVERYGRLPHAVFLEMIGALDRIDYLIILLAISD